MQLSAEILRAIHVVKKLTITSVEDLRDIIRRSQSALFRAYHTVFVTFDGEFTQPATGFLEMCVQSIQGASLYVDDKLAITNLGDRPQTCGKVGMLAGKHRLQLRMIYAGGLVGGDVVYRSLEVEGAPFMQLLSPSPGSCALPGERVCYPPPPVDKCSIEFPEGTAPGRPVDSWKFQFLLNVPLEIGQYVDFILSDFAANSLTFALSSFTRVTDAAFVPTLPERKPQYQSLGCFKDVRTARALGAGKCGTFPDAGTLVTSVSACAEYAVRQRVRGFCVTEGHQCFVSKNFFLEYDK